MSNDDSNSAQPSNIISLHLFPFPIKNIPRSHLLDTRETRRIPVLSQKCPSSEIETLSFPQNTLPKAFENATTRSFAFHTITSNECWCARARTRGVSVRRPRFPRVQHSLSRWLLLALGLLNATQRPTKLPPRSAATVRWNNLGPLPRERKGREDFKLGRCCDHFSTIDPILVDRNCSERDTVGEMARDGHRWNKADGADGLISQFEWRKVKVRVDGIVVEARGSCEESNDRGSLIYESVTQSEKVVVPLFVLSFSPCAHTRSTCPNSAPTRVPRNNIFADHLQNESSPILRATASL